MSSKNMKRTQVFLPVVLVKMLDSKSAEYGISKGEIIRQALFQHFDTKLENLEEKRRNYDS